MFGLKGFGVGKGRLEKGRVEVMLVIKAVF